MHARALFTAIAWALLISRGNSECVLPHLAKRINWNMMAGPWYNSMLSTHALEGVTTCYSLVILREIPGDGAYVELRDIRSVSSSGEPNFAIIPQHLIYPGDNNTAILDPEYASIFVDEVEKDFSTADETTEDTAITETIDFHTIPFTLFTDYKNYFVTLQCIGDSPRIFVHTRHPNPPAQRVRHVVKEALERIGDGWDEEEMHSAPCTRLNIRDPIIGDWE